MATTENALTGLNGTKKKFPFTFPYLKPIDLKVELVRTTTADSTTTKTTLDSTKFTFPTATEVELASTAGTNWQETSGAPKADGGGYTYSGRVYRSTSSDQLAATFYPGSAIRAGDLNDNYTQNLYVTQEASNIVTTADADAASALATATTANNTANTANTTANTANTNATNAVSTANTASTNATNAVSTANTASTNATNAVTTANSAEAAVSTVLPFTIVSNKAALLAATVSEDDIYEVTDTTDLEDLGDSDDVIWVNSAGSTSGQDIAALKPNVTWDSGITLKMKKYGTSNTDRKWIFQSYFSNDPETKYAPKASPTFTGTVAGPTINASTALQIGGTAITSTATELNILDGVTSTTAELNKLDGFTGDKDDLIYAKDLKATGVTDTEFDYLDGVSSNIQTQLDAKAALASPTFTGTVTAANVSTDGQYIQQEETLTVSTNASTVDCSTGNYFTVQATGNITFTFGTPPADTKSYAMVIEIDHNSGTLTWPASVKWPADTAPTLTAAKTHQFYFHTNDNGSRWRGASLVDYVD